MEYASTFFGVSFGLIFGSFLNALIYRIPKRIGLFLPRSFLDSIGNFLKSLNNEFKYPFLPKKESLKDSSSSLFFGTKPSTSFSNLLTFFNTL